jgi:hypothetical protein
MEALMLNSINEYNRPSDAYMLRPSVFESFSSSSVIRETELRPSMLKDSTLDSYKSSVLKDLTTSSLSQQQVNTRISLNSSINDQSMMNSS